MSRAGRGRCVLMGWAQTLAGRLWASGDTEPSGESGPDLARWLLPSGAAESQVRGQVRSG